VLSRSTKLRLGLVLAVIAALCALIGASSASAANVVNGDFETGTLEGWQVYNSNAKEKWVVAKEEEGTLPPPLSGRFAAISAMGAPGTTILYQDVALEPAASHRLEMTLAYQSFEPIVIPSPDSLDAEEPFENQQFRVDVMKPTAPIESLAPSDVLATVFATQESENETEAGKEGEPALEPTRLSVDLTRFAGQTVRLRFAVAVNLFPLQALVDAVSITSTPVLTPPAPLPAPTPPSNKIVKGKLTLNKKNGTGTLFVTVPDAGTLTAQDASTRIAIASLSAKGGSKPALIRTVSLHPSVAGTVKVPIKPTASGRRVLSETGKLTFRARLTFTPTGGTAATQVYKAKLVKTLKARR
jgi:hypothetical protein